MLAQVANLQNRFSYLDKSAFGDVGLVRLKLGLDSRVKGMKEFGIEARHAVHEFDTDSQL